MHLRFNRSKETAESTYAMTLDSAIIFCNTGLSGVPNLLETFFTLIFDQILLQLGLLKFI